MARSPGCGPWGARNSAAGRQTWRLRRSRSRSAAPWERGHPCPPAEQRLGHRRAGSPRSQGGPCPTDGGRIGHGLGHERAHRPATTNCSGTRRKGLSCSTVRLSTCAPRSMTSPTSAYFRRSPLPTLPTIRRPVFTSWPSRVNDRPAASPLPPSLRSRGGSRPLVRLPGVRRATRGAAGPLGPNVARGRAIRRARKPTGTRG